MPLSSFQRWPHTHASIIVPEVTTHACLYHGSRGDHTRISLCVIFTAITMKTTIFIDGLYYVDWEYQHMMYVRVFSRSDDIKRFLILRADMIDVTNYVVSEGTSESTTISEYSVSAAISASGVKEPEKVHPSTDSHRGCKRSSLYSSFLK